jgi:hypothetical protein
LTTVKALIKGGIKTHHHHRVKSKHGLLHRHLLLHQQLLLLQL